jgi:hypothetical protein
MLLHEKIDFSVDRRRMKKVYISTNFLEKWRFDEEYLMKILNFGYKMQYTNVFQRHKNPKFPELSTDAHFFYF